MLERPLRPLDIQDGWQSLISRLLVQVPRHSSSKLLVCGPKSSGKSTFSRVLANAILTRYRGRNDSGGKLDLRTQGVAVLDLDPGQPEYSLPGQIALHHIRSCNFGPPFTHPIIDSSQESQTIKTHCFGYLSPKESPNLFMECVLDLFRHYGILLRELPACPLLVNCSGWIQGEGVRLLKQLIEDLQISNVIFTSTSGPDEVVEELSRTCGAREVAFDTITSQPFATVSRTASELRTMQTLSYFHLADPEGGQLRWNATPLVDQAPLRLSFSGRQQSIFAVLVPGEAVNDEFLETVLEGSIVDVVLIEDDAAVEESSSGIEAQSVPIIDTEDDNEFGSDTHDEAIADAEFRSDESNLLAMDEGEAGSYQTYRKTTSLAPSHLRHPCVARSPSLIPYIRPTNHVARPLLPKHSRSVGQALIRSIDISTHTFHLLTPISADTIASMNQQQRKLVLVRGKLDTPTWAYEEAFEYEKYIQRRIDREKTVVEGTEERDDGREAVEAMVEETPWAEISEGVKRKGKGARKRSGRRDLRYRSQAKNQGV